jgi:hypothetical protein
VIPEAQHEIELRRPLRPAIAVVLASGRKAQRPGVAMVLRNGLL